MILALAPVTLHASAAQHASLVRAAAQVVAAVVAIPVGMQVGALIGVLFVTDAASLDSPGMSRIELGGIIGLASAAAIAVRLVGTGDAPHARMLDAGIGAVPGYAIVVGLGKLIPALRNGRLKNRIARSAVWLLGMLLMAVGAVLAYDLPPR
jgi:hypothetical protein